MLGDVHRRDGYSVVVRPAAADATRDHQVIAAQLTAPFRGGHALAVMLNDQTARGVARLLGLRGPSAVFRRVRAAVVNALNGRAFKWAWSHIGVELLKAILPCLADRDASGAVVAVRLARRPVASGFHTGPRFMLSCMAQSVRAVANFGELVASASAPSARSRFQAAHRNIRTSTAAALTLIVASVASPCRFSDNGPVSKCLVRLRVAFRLGVRVHLADCSRNSAEVYR